MSEDSLRSKVSDNSDGVSLLERISWSIIPRRRKARTKYIECRFNELTNGNGQPITLKEYFELGQELKRENCSMVFCRDFKGNYIPLSVSSGILTSGVLEPYTVKG